jgi:hypothetical protein
MLRRINEEPLKKFMYAFAFVRKGMAEGDLFGGFAVESMGGVSEIKERLDVVSSIRRARRHRVQKNDRVERM